MVPLAEPLQSGQVIEVMTARHGAPSRDWLNPARGFLKTAAARAKVRHWFKVRDHDRHLSVGRAILEREGRRLGLAEIDMAATARHFGLKTPHDLLAALAAATSGRDRSSNGWAEPAGSCSISQASITYEPVFVSLSEEAGIFTASALQRCSDGASLNARINGL